jgi:hypothetical protein
LDDLQLSEFADELDVAQHLALGQVLGLLLVAGDLAHRQLLILLQKVAPETRKSLCFKKYFPIIFPPKYTQ